MTESNSIEALDVYLRRTFIGKLKSDNAGLSFTYDANYLAFYNKALSVSMPLQKESFDHQITSSFFSGLLPDGIVRVRLARYLKTSKDNTFVLLKHIGGECAGAVSLHPEGSNPAIPTASSYHILDEDEADDILSSVAMRPFLAGEEGVRISAAGAQDKLIIALIDNKIAIPINNSPSTHIIKPVIKDFSHSVHNEFFCMKLAKKVGLKVAEVDILWIKNKAYYLVARYDRKLSQNRVIRLHQEDFCQALHIPSEKKYESDGGPGISDCFKLLDDRIAFGSMSGMNRLHLLRAIIFNFLIGNGDAHGKNFSLLYNLDEESLAPLYDLLCTVVYSDTTMSMQIDGRYYFKIINMKNWKSLSSVIGFREDFIKLQILNMSKAILKAAPDLALELNSKTTTASVIYKEILSVISTNCKIFTMYKS